MGKLEEKKKLTSKAGVLHGQGWKTQGFCIVRIFYNHVTEISLQRSVIYHGLVFITCLMCSLSLGFIAFKQVKLH